MRTQGAVREEPTLTIFERSREGRRAFTPPPADVPETPVCPQCDQASVRPLDVKEVLLRLAGQFECPVEVVEQTDALMALGGVGCLLRARREARNGRTGPHPRLGHR